MKKYSLTDLKIMNGLPVYINVLNKEDVYKSGWYIVKVVDGNDNIFVSNGDQTLFISEEFLDTWYEVLDREPKPKKKVYNKLIRDNMKKIVESDCKVSSFKYVEGEEKLKALKNKLQEEVDEFLESEHCSEIADIQEVLLCLTMALGHTPGEIEQIRMKKKMEKGSFCTGLYLESIEFNDR